MDWISSTANKRVKALCALAKKPTPKAFLIEGYHMVEMAYVNQCLDEILSTKESPYPEVPFTGIGQEVLEKIATSKNPEPILGLAHLPNEKEIGNRVLILDRVQDPGNVGTILRTALAFGFKDVYFLPGTCTPMNAKCLASTQGAIFEVNLHFPDDGLALLKELKEKGYEVLGSALQDSTPMETYAPKGEKLALILGNEGQGMKEELRNECSFLLLIRMEAMESLNVGIAGGILMHHLSLNSDENVR
ncbi:MAG: TrmH family RNA methyltransferase [Candidatus Enteromonas sp.]